MSNIVKAESEVESATEDALETSPTKCGHLHAASDENLYLCQRTKHEIDDMKEESWHREGGVTWPNDNRVTKYLAVPSWQQCGGFSRRGDRCVLPYLHGGPHSNAGWTETGRMWLEDDFDP